MRPTDIDHHHEEREKIRARLIEKFEGFLAVNVYARSTLAAILSGDSNFFNKLKNPDHRFRLSTLTYIENTINALEQNPVIRLNVPGKKAVLS